LKVRWEVSDLPRSALLPNLTLQPLLENAIYHGVESVPEGGEVLVTGRAQGERLVIEISNPVAKGSTRLREGNQMALSNIRQRFELAYGTRGQVAIEDRETSFTVRLEFPLEEDRQ
jgi:two-component system sensor histidine kinase AlgZ